MSYVTYKILHILSIFAFLMLITVQSYTSEKTVRRRNSIITGALALLILTGGMGLMARLGGGFQPWILAKVGFWFLAIGGGEVLVRRTSNRLAALGFVWGVCALAAYFAITKPI